ncbi:hypothetical protein E2C01_091350 [Portunus trituberculatus]|uniref:Uncharacterized protein n=1 Tax=Portunus trituberculatus TaxID=210409 RepID=A0A5B7JDR4_PORTR|nr:hypothetical protein [Portunus trituberculatus]
MREQSDSEHGSLTLPTDHMTNNAYKVLCCNNVPAYPAAALPPAHQPLRGDGRVPEWPPRHTHTHNTQKRIQSTSLRLITDGCLDL